MVEWKGTTLKSVMTDRIRVFIPKKSGRRREERVCGRNSASIIAIKKHSVH